MIWLLIALVISMIPMWAIGMLTFIQWIRPAQGIDKSNVINRVRLWWFALTRQSLFVGLFPWLLNDELDNIKNKKD